MKCFISTYYWIDKLNIHSVDLEPTNHRPLHYYGVRKMPFDSENQWLKFPKISSLYLMDFTHLPISLILHAHRGSQLKISEVKIISTVRKMEVCNNTVSAERKSAQIKARGKRSL